MIKKYLTKPYKKDHFIIYVEHKYILYGFVYRSLNYGGLYLDNKVHVVVKELFRQGDCQPSFKVNFYEALKGLNISEKQLLRIING